MPQISRLRNPSKKRHLSTDLASSSSRGGLQSKSISSLISFKPEHKKTNSTIPTEISFKNSNKLSQTDSLQTFKTHLVQELPRVRSTIFNSDSLRNKWDVLNLCMTYRSGKDLEPNLSMISSIIKALEILSKEPGKYREEMEMIVSQLKICVYNTRDRIPSYLQDEIFELFTDTVVSMDSNIPYFYLYQAMLSIYEKYRSKVSVQDSIIKDLENSKR
jgi:hypothetical protein